MTAVNNSAVSTCPKRDDSDSTASAVSSTSMVAGIPPERAT
ncbi:MAG: hypothetical protein R2704_10175 [Microthrixaceae bacterium]